MAYFATKQDKYQKKKDLFTCKEDENVIQEPSVSVASCASTFDGSLTSTAEDVISNEVDTAELQESNESLNLYNITNLRNNGYVVRFAGRFFFRRK